MQTGLFLTWYCSVCDFLSLVCILFLFCILVFFLWTIFTFVKHLVCTCSPVSGPGCPAGPAAAAQTEVLWCPPEHEVDSLKAQWTPIYTTLQPCNVHKQNKFSKSTTQLAFCHLTYICEILLSYFDFQGLHGGGKKRGFFMFCDTWYMVKNCNRLFIICLYFLRGNSTHTLHISSQNWDIRRK